MFYRYDVNSTAVANPSASFMSVVKLRCWKNFEENFEVFAASKHPQQLVTCDGTAAKACQCT